MYKYIITHKDIPGEELEVTYNADGRLLKWDATNMHSLQTNQLQWLKNYMPMQLTDVAAQFTAIIEAAKNKIAITQSEFDASFETFWNAFDNKLHKKDAQRLFEKLSYADKVKCIQSCAPYKRYCQRKGEWYNQQLPDTYISKRNFETEWNKVR
jgi:YD repeat-containing protein